MQPVQKHYDQHLSHVYTWLAGGMEAALERNRLFFETRQIHSDELAWAVDLGCGSGFQVIPLATAGFQVLGIDFCENLLDECRRQTVNMPVRLVLDDLLNFPAYLPAAASLIVCQGDTLTHLATREDVRRLIDQAGANLAPSGRLVLTFRDYTRELTGLDRFIPVRADDNRIFTCHLEYVGPHVQVHDLWYEKVDGHWQFRASCYPKLRLSPEDILNDMVTAGLTIEENSVERGMCCVIGRK